MLHTDKRCALYQSLYVTDVSTTPRDDGRYIPLLRLINIPPPKAQFHLSIESETSTLFIFSQSTSDLLLTNTQPHPTHSLTSPNFQAYNTRLCQFLSRDIHAPQPRHFALFPS
ncbi:hypothetical protein KCU90_g20952, partial [Aureobasidium melanogenum]